MATLTADGTHYVSSNSNLKARSYLFVNSELLLAPGYSWSSSLQPQSVYGTNLLPQIDYSGKTYVEGHNDTPVVHVTFSSVALSQTTATVGTWTCPALQTSLSSDINGIVAAGVARTILKIATSDPDTSTTGVLVPITHICASDYKKARTLSHNLLPFVNGPYSDTLEPLGTVDPSTGVNFNNTTFSIYTGFSLPTGLTLTGDTITGTPTGHPTNIVVEQDQTTDGGLLRRHWRKLGISTMTQAIATTPLGVDTDGNNVLPTKFIFPTDSTLTLPSKSGGPEFYGQDQTTSINGTMNYVKISGGTAPYKVRINSITVRNSGLFPIVPTSVFTIGTVLGAEQFYLGFTSNAVDNPSPIQRTGDASADPYGLNWYYQISGQRFYIKNLQNGGQIRSDVTGLPVSVILEIEILDAKNVIQYTNFIIPIVSAPVTPEVISPKAIIETRSPYNMSLGVPIQGTTTLTPLLSGFPYNLQVSSSLFRVDMPWWRPVLSSPIPGSFNLNLVDNTIPPQGGPYVVTLFEKYPTAIDPQNPTSYDYIEVQRKLPAFSVTGPMTIACLGTDSPNTYSFPYDRSVGISLQVLGGVTPYTWTYDLSGVPGLLGQPDSTTGFLNITGFKSSTSMLSETYTINVMVADSTAPSPIQSGQAFQVTFYNYDSGLLGVSQPYMNGDFRIYYFEPSNAMWSDRTKFPFSNTLLYDFANDYSDGTLPGGLTQGFITAQPLSYTVKVINPNPSVWNSLKYKMPFGLSFGLQRLTLGGYQTTGYYQINGSIGVIGGSSSVTDELDSNGKRIGFTIGSLPLKSGDIIIGAIDNRLPTGVSKSQAWELGYKFPHFELLQSMSFKDPLDSIAENDHDATKTVTYSNDITEFKTVMDGGLFDNGVYDYGDIGKAKDTLQINVTKDGITRLINVDAPCAENNTAKVWVAGADQWGNPSYYWLGSKSNFFTSLNNNSQTIYFGFTECDRILKPGAFVSSSSSMYPSLKPIIPQIVNYYLTTSTNATHSLNTSLHATTDFLNVLQKFITYPSTGVASLTPGRPNFMWDHFNQYLDNPALDQSTYKYFLTPNPLGEKIGGSSLSHPSLTNIDRGFRFSVALDAHGLWQYLNGTLIQNGNTTGLESGAKLHVVLVFLMTRPNIDLSTQEAQSKLDLATISEACDSSLSPTTMFLRGKTYMRVPIHLVLENGASQVTLPPEQPNQSLVVSAWA